MNRAVQTFRSCLILLGMATLIGIDEAGYGPNLGPLVVAATTWEVLASAATPNAPPVDLHTCLADLITLQPTTNRIAIADSKQLYKPGQGLAQLERGVLTALAALDRRPTNWCDLISEERLPWYADYDCAIPIDATSEEIDLLADRFKTCCEDASVGLVDLRARVVFPNELNQLTEQYDSKGAALSHLSIGLLRKMLDNLPPNPQSPAPNSCFVTFDKHGGRNRYGELLQHHFADQRIETLLESRPASRYRWGPPEARVEVCFRTKGEAELPTALASMTAKYHRELAMRAFNKFWRDQIPGLRPTAGYPVDAKRFRAEISAKQRQLGIADGDLWRNR